MNIQFLPGRIKCVQYIYEGPVPGNTATGLAFIIVSKPFTEFNEHGILFTNITVTAIVFISETIKVRPDSVSYFILYAQSRGLMMDHFFFDTVENIMEVVLFLLHFHQFTRLGELRMIDQIIKGRNIEIAEDIGNQIFYKVCILRVFCGLASGIEISDLQVHVNKFSP
jgi:hypothetical protein